MCYTRIFNTSVRSRVELTLNQLKYNTVRYTFQLQFNTKFILLKASQVLCGFFFRLLLWVLVEGYQELYRETLNYSYLESLASGISITCGPVSTNSMSDSLFPMSSLFSVLFWLSCCEDWKEKHISQYYKSILLTYKRQDKDKHKNSKNHCCEFYCVHKVYYFSLYIFHIQTKTSYD